jgi:hypothetical protein
MESKKRKKLSKSPDNIKDHIFRNLPEGSAYWIVIAWGKVVNDQDGYYKQEIILKKGSAKDSASKIWNLKDMSKLVYIKINIGSLRVFTPGTIIKKKRIVKFPHEYLQKIDIAIENPQAFDKRSLLVLNFPIFKDLKRQEMTHSIDKIETRTLPYQSFGQLMIPCNVIADYYYYGYGKHLIEAILEGNINPRFAVKNDIYNPKRLRKDVSPTGKVVVRVELQRRMELRDKYKIARLAHDDFFRDKCLDINTTILKGTLAESYVDTDLPVQGPIVLSVYGVQLNLQGDSTFLVHSISKCTSQPPFDLVLAGKEFRGKSALPDSGADGTDKSKLGLGSTIPPGKKRTRKKLQKPDSKIIDTDPSQWDAIPEDLPFENDQEDNFSGDAAVNELDLADPEKRDGIIKTLLKFGVAPTMSTDPKKKGYGNILPINLSAQGPAKPRPAPCTEAFEIIEKLVAFLESHYKNKGYTTTSTISRPVPEGPDKYSAFPVHDLLKEPNADKKRRYLFYAFQHIQQKGHTHHRRVFINILAIDGHHFYIMDVEPKYKKHNEKGEVEKLLSSAGVIFYAEKGVLDDICLIDILKQIVRTYQTPDGRWEFLRRRGFSFEKITHHGGQRSYESIVRFISACLPKA